MLEKDPRYATEVYELEVSNPPGKVVIRKGADVVFIWPGDLSKLIADLIDLEWKMMVGKGEVAVEA